MAKRKAAKKRKVGGGRKGAMVGGTKSTGRLAAQPKRRNWPDGKTPQPRVFRRTARLAQDALDALEAGRLDQVREYLQSIQAVARSADEP